MTLSSGAIGGLVFAGVIILIAVIMSAIVWLTPNDCGSPLTLADIEEEEDRKFHSDLKAIESPV